jgi:hypothetical protein
VSALSDLEIRALRWVNSHVGSEPRAVPGELKAAVETLKGKDLVRYNRLIGLHATPQAREHLQARRWGL